ncbi:MAG: glutaredoxin family protein, partial [Gammaproteobacteria bacterium]|nr:glutaredoxin family protein [Gammaproteobacteria bacterium]
MKLTGLAIILLISMPLNAAVTIVECEDANGDRTFQATCPPGTTQVDQREINTGVLTSASESQGNVTIRATLYSVPECVVCGDVKEFLESRDVIVTEKDASNEQLIQEELKALTGVLRVPVVVIGDQ